MPWVVPCAMALSCYHGATLPAWCNQVMHVTMVQFYTGAMEPRCHAILERPGGHAATGCTMFNVAMLPCMLPCCHGENHAAMLPWGPHHCAMVPCMLGPCWGWVAIGLGGHETMLPCNHACYYATMHAAMWPLRVLPWCHGAIVPWCHSTLVPRCHSAMLVPWGHHAWGLDAMHGPMAMVPCCHGTMVQWRQNRGAMQKMIHGANF